MKIRSVFPLGNSIAAVLASGGVLLTSGLTFAEQPAAAVLPETVVSATRSELEVDRVPSAVTVITAEQIEQRQYRTVTDALRSVPGLSIVQTGSPGQLTSVFLRGMPSDATQVMLDGIPINQGLSGAFNFADLTTDNVERIEVVRGPQSTVYGPRAGGGVVNIITKRGTTDSHVGGFFEAGSMGTFRESASASVKKDELDLSVGISRLDTENDRPNNEYRNTSAVVNLGVSPNERLRFFTIATFNRADTGNPGSIFSPRLVDNLLTERWLVGPGVEFQPTDWWKHRLATAYDEETQTNDPNQDGFLGATRALFTRFQLDYQNTIDISRWFKLTSGFFYSKVEAEQERPEILFGAPFIEDEVENTAAFIQMQFEPIKNLLFVASGRYDHFTQFDDAWTYRFAGSYKIEKTGTVFRASYATGFIPPSSQDRIFGNNPNLEPNKTRGWEVGFEQPLWDNRVRFGANYFHNNLSNVIGLDSLFQTLNLGSAETQGVEVFLSFNPIRDLMLAVNYTYLDTEKTSALDIAQLEGARLPRRPRNEFYISASYLWFKRLRTGIEAKYVNAREELNFGGPNFDIEDYTVVRLMAEYEVTRNFRIIARIENLTNQKYAEVFGYPNPGTAYYAGFNLKF
jgi:vitamin B12 transporter